jgi:hypothetical protein
MIGLGVGVDYALFLVTRYREGVRTGMRRDEAIARAVASDGAAVVFAGITVVIAICSLALAGTVWPHDNALVVLGLAPDGFREEANRIVLAQLDAAAHSGFRLPEAFAGFERWISRFRVPYPTACSPQAWATGAPLSFVQAMLGLHARDGELRLDPVIPAEIGRIEIGRLEAVGTRWDVDAEGTSGSVRPAA